MQNALPVVLSLSVAVTKMLNRFSEMSQWSRVCSDSNPTTLRGSFHRDETLFHTFVLVDGSGSTGHPFTRLSARREMSTWIVSYTSIGYASPTPMYPLNFFPYRPVMKWYPRLANHVWKAAAQSQDTSCRHTIIFLPLLISSSSFWNTTGRRLQAFKWAGSRVAKWEGEAKWDERTL